MADMMMFPDTWEEFEEQYGITDREEIYTNGARLIPSFRIKQWLDHVEDRKSDPVDVHDELSKRYARIENVIREESANIAEIVRQAVKGIELWPSTYSTLEIASKKLNKPIPELVDIAVRIVYLGIDQ